MRWSTSGIDPRAEDGIWGTERPIKTKYLDLVIDAYAGWCRDMHVYLETR